MKKGDVVYGKIDVEIKDFPYIEDIKIEIGKKYRISNISNCNFLDTGWNGMFYLGKTTSIIYINNSGFPLDNLYNGNINFNNFFITLAEWREQQINSILDE